MAEELNSDASELIRAARMPQTTNPLDAGGQERGHQRRECRIRHGTADSHCQATAGRYSIPLVDMAKAIMPGIRKRKTGVILRNAPKMAPRRACFWSRPESTRCTMNWSVHQYQKPMTDGAYQYAEPREVGVAVATDEVGHAVAVASLTGVNAADDAPSSRSSRLGIL